MPEDAARIRPHVDVAADSIVAAVRVNGISKVVFQSSAGAERRHGAGDIDGLRRAVSVTRIHEDEMRRQYLAASMPVPLAEAMLGMSTGLRDGFVREQQHSAASTTPTSLRTWVHAELATAL